VAVDYEVESTGQEQIPEAPPAMHMRPSDVTLVRPGIYHSTLFAKVSCYTACSLVTYFILLLHKADPTDELSMLRIHFNTLHVSNINNEQSDTTSDTMGLIISSFDGTVRNI
jgi:hypothetical protein